MGFGDYAVKNGICDGRFAEVLIPIGYGQLGTDDGRVCFVAVFEDLEQDDANLLWDWLDSKVVED